MRRTAPAGVVPNGEADMSLEPVVRSVSLSDEERAELLRVVESFLSDTRVEVRRTSTPEFHDALVHEKEVLESIREKLRSMGPL